MGEGTPGAGEIFQSQMEGETQRGCQRDWGPHCSVGVMVSSKCHLAWVYSCLENPMDRGAWLATVHGVTKSQTQLMW